MPRGALRTYLFADLRDYTVFVETRGDAATARLLRGFRSLVRAEVALRGGAEIHTEGDSFYVVFQNPGDALRCAIGVMRRARQHNEDHPELALHIGMGLNTGEAVAHGGGFVGSAVIVAKRLAEQARAGQILVTDTLRALVRTSALAAMRDLGPWKLKGIAEPQRVYEAEVAKGSANRALGPILPLPAALQPAPPQGTTGLVVCPALVQRERPLAALLEHLTAAAHGETRLVALSGEGGVGKSRLCRELARIADSDGLYVFAGRSYGASDPPYRPFVAALGSYARARGSDVLGRVLSGLIVELRRLLPEIDIAASTEDASISDEERRDRFLRTIQLLVEDAAALRPVLLVLEDFHYADAASRDLLRHIATTLRAGVCLVFTFREEELDSTHPLRGLIAELERERRLAHVALAPLDRTGVARMVEALLPDRATPELVDSLFERSEGVPFYVEELLKTALDTPGATMQALPLPSTVRDSVQVRVHRLVQDRGPAVREMLAAASLAEIPLTYEVLSRLTDRDEWQFAADLTACLEAQLLERTPTQLEAYRFRHALTREAVDSAVLAPERRRLHLRLAEALEAADSGVRRAPLLAHHFAAAGQLASSIRYARLGAGAAAQVGAYSGAIDLLEEASRVASGTAEERDVLEEQAVYLQAAGRASEAEHALTRARELAVAASDNAVAARLDVRLANVLRMLGRRSEAVAWAQRAADAMANDPNEVFAEAVCMLANLAWADNDPEQTASFARRALTIARCHQAIPVVVSALTLLGAALSRLGRAEGSDKLHEAIQLGLRHSLNAEVANAYLELSSAELLRGNSRDAYAAADAGIALARRHGLEFAQVRLLPILTRMDVNDGRYREARALAEQAVALARPDTLAAATAKTSLAHVMTDQGEYAEALALFDEIAPQIERHDPDRRMVFLAYRARALLGLGRLDDAEASAKAALELALATPGMGIIAFLHAAEVAEARCEISWLRQLSKAFERYFSGRDTPFIRVTRMEIGAILDLCEGRDAARSFVEVAQALESMLSAHVRAAYRRACSAIVRLGNPTERLAARRDLLALRTQLLERGALGYVAVIDRALKRPIPPRGRWTGPLSVRERDVAALISRGFTDRRIARELEVALPRATRLVEAVQKKLGVVSRSQVALWAAQRHEGGAGTTTIRTK